MPGTGPVLQALQEGGQGQHREVPAAHPPGCCQVRNAPAMLGRLWRSWKDWTVGCRCGMKGASSLPRRRRPVRDSSEPATGVPHLFLSHPPAPTAWGNAGRRLSNNWTQGSRTRGIRGPSPAAPPPASPKPPPRASRRSWRGRDGRRFRKPGARGCRFERSSGSWESTGPQSGNTWRPRVLLPLGDPGRILRRLHLIPWQQNRLTFLPAT